MRLRIRVRALKFVRLRRAQSLFAQRGDENSHQKQRVESRRKQFTLVNLVLIRQRSASSWGLFQTNKQKSHYLLSPKTSSRESIIG
jgi:hypothetical protein